MSAKIVKYSIDNFKNILNQGFDFQIPENTIKIISELALEVGSPDYVKTPVFQKKENPLKNDLSCQNSSYVKKNRRNKATEIVNDEHWEVFRNFQTTKLKNTTGIDAEIDSIRSNLNRLNDKNYIDISNKIFEIIDKIIKTNINNENENENENEDVTRVINVIFDIASNNRFYSKLYANLYTDLSLKYEFVKALIDTNLSNFTELFNNIEYVDQEVDYNKFCEINKINEKRKALASFYLNLMLNNIISKDIIINITRLLLFNIYTFINEENKKNQVDEIAEIVCILYKNELYNDNYEKIDGFSINEIIEKIAKSNVKDYKSLTTKTIFKFMDLIDM